MSEAHRDEDVVEQGGRGLGQRLLGRRFRLPDGWRPSPGRRPSRGATAFAVAALAVGLAVGYTAGDWHGRHAALPEPAPSASAAAAPAASLSFTVSPPLTQDIGACSVQSGRRLALGVQVTNQSTVPLTLESAKAVLPLGGLVPVSWQWTPCGALPQTLGGQVGAILLPGASTWLTMMFSVKLGCPAPLPVQFTIGYLAAGRSATASLPGFPDLSEVPYTGCPRNSAAAAGAQLITGP
jgi:hypothetical protein